MSYDWEKIFKEKTTKELLEIYTGHSFLPKSVIPFAKKELKKRNFEFEDTDTEWEVWNLTSMIREENRYQSNEILRRLTRNPLFIYIMVGGDFLVTWPKHHFLIWLVAAFVLATGFILISNYEDRKRQKASDKRRKEIAQLTRKLKNEGVLNNRNSISKETNAEAQKYTQRSYLLRSAIIVAVFISIVYHLVPYFH